MSELRSQMMAAPELDYQELSDGEVIDHSYRPVLEDPSESESGWQELPQKKRQWSSIVESAATLENQEIELPLLKQLQEAYKTSYKLLSTLQQNSADSYQGRIGEAAYFEPLSSMIEQFQGEIGTVIHEIFLITNPPETVPAKGIGRLFKGVWQRFGGAAAAQPDSAQIAQKINDISQRHQKLLEVLPKIVKQMADTQASYQQAYQDRPTPEASALPKPDAFDLADPHYRRAYEFRRQQSPAYQFQDALQQFGNNAKLVLLELQFYYQKYE